MNSYSHYSNYSKLIFINRSELHRMEIYIAFKGLHKALADHCGGLVNGYNTTDGHSDLVYSLFPGELKTA